MAVDPALQTLIDYAQLNERVCPMPRRWLELYNLLPPPARGESKPALPLILGGWWDTSSEAKKQRFREHLEYAACHGALPAVDRFVRALPEPQWAHRSDLNA